MAPPTTKINPSDAEVLNALGVIVQFFAALTRDQRRAGTDQNWIDQHASTLGNRRHCLAARRRIAEGAGGAEQVGRRWLLTRVALDEEVARTRLKRVTPASADEDARELAAELGLKLLKGGKP